VSAPRRVAVVTGAAASIGQAYALRLAAEGVDVVVADVADGAETVGRVRRQGGRALAVRCDVSSAEDVRALATAAVEGFGPVDILVHNAAIYPSTPFAEMSFDEWRRVMSVNLDSCFHLFHELLPGMRRRGWGRVICIASNTFHSGVGGMTHYVASKGGVIGLVRGLASEVGIDGVTVNAIAPSLVRSQGTWTGLPAERAKFEKAAQMQAIKRTEVPADLVGAVSFLASDDAGFITGQTLVVDGGWVRA